VCGEEKREIFMRVIRGLRIMNTVDVDVAFDNDIRLVWRLIRKKKLCHVISCQTPLSIKLLLFKTVFPFFQNILMRYICVLLLAVYRSAKFFNSYISIYVTCFGCASAFHGF